MKKTIWLISAVLILVSLFISPKLINAEEQFKSTNFSIINSSFFSDLDWWMWVAIGIIVVAVIVMGALIIFLPKKKRVKTAEVPGRTRVPPQVTPVQPVPVQTIPGQRMAPPIIRQQQGEPPYPVQQAQAQVPRPQPYQGQSPVRAVPQYQESQQSGHQVVPQQMSPFPGQTQPAPQKPFTPYPGQPQTPQRPMPAYQGQQSPAQNSGSQQTQPLPGQIQKPLPSDTRQAGAVPVFTPPGQMGFPPKNAGIPARVAPQFVVSNLIISPQQVKDGDAISISAVVTNKTSATLPYSMVFRIGGVVEEICELTLNPGMSQTGLFTVAKDEPGDYYVEVDGQRGMFTVTRRLPPAFNVSNLTITPDKVKQGEPVTISAIASNTGEIKGSYSVVLRIKGIAENIEEVELEPGRSQKVTFNIIKDAAGFYPVAIENLSGRFVVEMDWKG